MINNKKIILLVDDEKDILYLFCECLQAWGYQTISFTCPKEALNYIDNNISNCSLIITDYKMPEMDGIDFIKRIKDKYINNDNGSFSLKIMLISAFMKNDLDIQQQNTLNSLKIDKIIEKPIRLEILKEEVEKLMNKQQQQPFPISK